MKVILLILGNPGRQALYLGTSVFLIGLIILFLMERYVPYMIVGLSYIALIIISLTLADTTLELIQGRSLIFFICPVALAGLLLYPWAGYVVAGLVSVGISIVGDPLELRHTQYSDLFPIFYDGFNYSPIHPPFPAAIDEETKRFGP